MFGSVRLQAMKTVNVSKACIEFSVCKLELFKNQLREQLQAQSFVLNNTWQLSDGNGAVWMESVKKRLRSAATTSAMPRETNLKRKVISLRSHPSSALPWTSRAFLKQQNYLRSPRSILKPLSTTLDWLNWSQIMKTSLITGVTRSKSARNARTKSARYW